MKKFKKVFYPLYFVFLAVQVFMLIYVTYYPDQMFGFYLRNINRIIGMLQSYLIFGFLVLVIEWVSENLHIKILKNKIKDLENENNALKARYYDEEEKKKQIDSSLQAFGESLERKKTNKPDAE
jgi:hypothetical protein